MWKELYIGKKEKNRTKAESIHQEGSAMKTNSIELDLNTV